MARDAEGLFELVRDDLAVIPGPGGFYGAGTARRFGSRATLRGGMGTLRERADLLAELLVEAGFEAEVFVGKPEADFDLDALLERPAKRTFAPPTSTEDRARWLSVLPELPADFTVSALDPERSEVDSVLALLDEAGVSAAGALPLDFELRELPFVRATIEGESVDLNPNYPGSKWGETHALDAELAPEASPLESVSVRLGVARANQPDVEIPLVEKTWSVDELVGRTVTAAFATQFSLREAGRTSAERAQSFIPTLQVKGADLSDATAQELSAVGEAMTRGGEIIRTNNEGALVGDERVAPAPSDSELLASVDSVVLEVDDSAFPEVSVLVTLKDEDGELVSGLAADAFSLEEEGAAIPAVLRRSELPPPRVAFLFDRSSSLPPEFLEDVAATGHEMAAAIFGAVPGATIQVLGMDFNGPAVAGGFVASIEEVDAQLSELGGAASEVWTNLGALAESDADLIVLVSDFVAEDESTPDILRALAGGAPILAVAVGEADEAVAERVAEVSHGARVDGVDGAGVAVSAAEFALGQAAYTYRIVYRASIEGPSERTVRVQVDGERLNAEATYTVSEDAAPLPSISGVFVTVVTAGREVRRLVAGSLERGVEPSLLEEADAMLFGRAVLGVEAGPPSLAEKLDEHIAERLKLESLVDATWAGDRKKATAALATSRSRTPANLRFAFSAGPDEAEGPSTYPEGVSTALYVERPIFGRGVRRSLDWLPLAPRRTAARDPEEAFEITLRRTAYLAAIEARRFPKSTLSLMKEEPVASYDPLTIDATLGSEWYEPVQSYAGRLLIAPTDGSPLAFVGVDPLTGDVIGGLPDGSGGAVAAEVEQTLAQIDSILSLAERAGELGGFNGIKVWTDLERTKAELVGAATILIGEGGPEPDLAETVGDALAGAVEDGITGEIPGWDDAFAPADDLGDIYDAFEAFTGHEMPDVGSPSFTE